MATFTTLVEIFCNTKVTGFGEILSSETFHVYAVTKNSLHSLSLMKRITPLLPLPIIELGHIDKLRIRLLRIA